MKEQELSSLAIKELGIEELSPDMQKDVLARLGEAALKSALLEIFEKLPKSAEAEFKKLSEEGDLSKTQYFLKQHIPDYETIMQREIKKVVESFKRIKAGLS